MQSVLHFLQCIFFRFDEEQEGAEAHFLHRRSMLAWCQVASVKSRASAALKGVCV